MLPNADTFVPDILTSHFMHSSPMMFRSLLIYQGKGSVAHLVRTFLRASRFHPTPTPATSLARIPIANIILCHYQNVKKKPTSKVGYIY